MFSTSNNQEFIQSSDTSFHMKSTRFHCAPCNRQFSFLNPENGRALCPRCDNISTRLVSDNTQSQPRNSANPNNNARQNSSQPGSRPHSQARQSRPSRQTMFVNGNGDFFQTILPEVYFMQPEFEEEEYPQQQQQDFGGMFGFSSMFGMNQPNVYSDFNQQRYNQYSYSPIDLLGGLFGEVQNQASPMYRMGDQLLTAEEYERLVEEFISSDPNQYGPPPASEEGMKKLKEFDYDSSICKSTDCSVCQDSYKKGERCVQLPCEHNYHKDCVTEWLLRHDSCPVCRKSLSGKRTDMDKIEEEIGL